MIDVFVNRVVQITYEQVDIGCPIAATDLLVYEIDTWLSAGEYWKVRVVLDCLDPDRVPPQVITGVLSTTWLAKDKLEPSRCVFMARALSALEQTWGLSVERREKIVFRLG